MKRVVVLSVSSIILFLLSFQKTDNINDLIQEKENYLHFCDSSYLPVFDSLKKGSNFHIIHLGDSHIEMGAFSEGILSTFAENQHFFSEGWFVPPFSYETKANNKKERDEINHHSVRNNHLQNGLTGRHLSIKDKVYQLQVKNNKSIHEVSLLMQGSTIGSKMELNGGQHEFHLERGTTVLHSARPNKSKKTLSLKITMNSGDSCTIYGFKINNPKRSYSNFGVSGATFRHFLSAEEFERQVSIIKHNLIIVTLGTNDSYSPKYDSTEFMLYLSHLNFLSKNTGSKLILMTAPDTYYKQKTPPHLAQIKRMLKTFCAENSIALWDWNAVMGGEGSMLKWEQSKYKNGDYLHFSKAAYRKFGRLFAESVLRYK